MVGSVVAIRRARFSPALFVVLHDYGLTLTVAYLSRVPRMNAVRLVSETGLVYWAATIDLQHDVRVALIVQHVDDVRASLQGINARLAPSWW